MASDAPTATNVLDEEKGPYTSRSSVTAASTHSSEKASSFKLPQTTSKELGSTNGEDIEVSLDDDEKPVNMPVLRKWAIVFVICSGATLTTCASSMASATFPGVEKRFNEDFYVTALTISLYILGLGVGPLLLGGLSETFGRTPIYRFSFLFGFLFSFPVAFAPNMAVLLVFRFVVAFASSAFLSVGGGSIADLFINQHVALPIALYGLAPLIGPVIGPLLAGFINQHAYWRWTYHVITIWFGVELVLVYFFIPETYPPLLTSWKAQKLRKETGDGRYYAPLERQTRSTGHTIAISVYKPFQLMYHEPMLFLLDLWTSLILGIVYLTFPVFPVIFGGQKGFNQQSVGLSYLGIGAGMLLAFATQPWWINRFMMEVKKHNGAPPPEVRLHQGMVAALLIPLGLFLFAFTLYRQVHWIVPIILIIPFGAGVFGAFVSVFTFIIATYRSLAASAIASNTFLRSVFAAAFPLISKSLYERLGDVGATALLAGLMTLFAPLPFLFHHYGARLRANSRYAWSEPTQ